MGILTTLEEKARDPEFFDRARKAIYHLHRRQFIWAGDHAVGGYYSVLANPNIQAFIEDYFSVEGLVIYHNTTEQWIGLVPGSDMFNVMPDERLKGDETLVLLILAKCWQDGVNNAAAGHRGVVVVTAYDALSMMKMITKKDLVKPVRFKEILKDYARRSIVALGEEDPEHFDYEIDIRPLISSFITADLADRLIKFAVSSTPELADVDLAEENGEDTTIDDSAGFAAARMK